MRGLHCSLVLLVLSALTAAYGADEVKVSLIKGTVRNSIGNPFGSTQVTARITNLSDKPLKSVAIMSSYKTFDMSFQSEFGGGYHTFRMNPPLAPGKSKVVTFKDSNGSKYVGLKSDDPQFVGSPATVWVEARKIPALLINGRLHVPARALITALEGKLESGAPGEIVLRLGDHQAKVARASSRPIPPVIGSVERDGQTYVPLVELAKQLPIILTRDAKLNKYTVEFSIYPPDDTDEAEATL